MKENDDNKFMRRCLDLAIKAEGLTYPNPLVGSVVVHKGKIIGEGFHLRAGMPHAEVNAINSVSEKEKKKLKESTLYVNLEPCSHFGKTPPCTDLIIHTGIPKVVIGTSDTSEKVSGQGAARLRDAGCEVVTGILEQESRWINRRFFTYNEKKRPYIILKWAQSADAFIDILRSEGVEPAPTWISGKPERVLVHKWRASEQSILAGAGTIRADNPKLNVREWKGSDPLKIILSSSGNFGNNHVAAETGGSLVVFTHNPGAVIPGAIHVNLKKDEISCHQIAEYLYHRGIQSLLIEGGTKVLNHFILNNMWDEARIFSGKDFFRNGVKAPVLKGKLISEDIFSGSLLQVYTNEGF